MSEQSLDVLKGHQQGYCTMEDIRRHEEQRPVKERLEEDYRRGYRDGWVQAVLAMSDLMFQDRLSRQTALNICYDLWQGELLDWVRGDCSCMELPPWQGVFEKGGGIR